MQAYKADKKPLHVIHPAGYKAVSDVSEHYANVIREVAGGSGNDQFIQRDRLTIYCLDPKADSPT